MFDFKASQPYSPTIVLGQDSNDRINLDFISSRSREQHSMMAELPSRLKPDTVPDLSGLSSRGTELSGSSATLDKFKKILGDVYHPDTNPRGIINIGTAENVEKSIVTYVRTGKLTAL